MKTITGCCLFAAGAVIGFTAGNFALKKKYEKQMDEAVESVKQVYSKKKPVKINTTINRETVESREERKEAERNSPEIAEFNKLKKESEYVNYSNCTEDPDKVVTLGSEDESTLSRDGIAIIAPNELDEFEDYRSVNLSYYRDGVLADERDNVVDVPEAVIGDLNPDELLSGGETAVYLRNDLARAYVEIVKDDRVFYGDIIPDEEEDY